MRSSLLGPGWWKVPNESFFKKYFLQIAIVHCSCVLTKSIWYIRIQFKESSLGFHTKSRLLDVEVSLQKQQKLERGKKKNYVITDYNNHNRNLFYRVFICQWFFCLFVFCFVFWRGLFFSWISNQDFNTFMPKSNESNFNFFPFNSKDFSHHRSKVTYEQRIRFQNREGRQLK